MARRRRVLDLPAWVGLALIVPLAVSGWSLFIALSVRNLRAAVETDVRLTTLVTTVQTEARRLRTQNGDPERVRSVFRDTLTAIRESDDATLRTYAASLSEALSILENPNGTGRDAAALMSSVDEQASEAVMVVRRRLSERSEILGRRWTQLTVAAFASLVMAFAFGAVLIIYARSRDEIARLRGILPICAYCKSIRTDQDYWQRVEQYVSERSDVAFSHGICPDCYPRVRARLEQE